MKVCSGRRGRLPKHFVSRRKLCLPASTGYWVSALGGRPLLCLHRDLDPTMTHAPEHDILPAPDLAGGEAVAPALTPVFDREGWSPALFARLARRGVAVITWPKGFRDGPWPEGEFRTVRAPLHSPGGVRTAGVRLAERRITLSGGPQVRRIRRLVDSGRQVPPVTTDMHTPMERIAGALFPRRSRESLFKYMRREFGLDALAVHGPVGRDPAARVVNPHWRRCDRRIRQLRRKPGTLRNRVADLPRGAPSDTAVTSAATLGDGIVTLDAGHGELRVRRSETPKHVTVAGPDGLDALPSGERLPPDIVRMVACRAETRMMAAVARAQGARQRPRRPLAEVFQSDADIVPDRENRVLRVRFPGTAGNARDADIAGLPDEPNQTRTIFPGTDLRMIHEMPDNPPKLGPEASN